MSSLFMSVVCDSGPWHCLYRATCCAMVASTSPQCKLLHTTLMNNEVQRSKSFHTAVVQYYSVVGHSLPYYINLVVVVA